MKKFERHLGIKVDAKHYAILISAIDAGFGENYSQATRMALREFAENHNLEVNENE